MRLPARDTLLQVEYPLYDHDVTEFHGTDERSHSRLFYFSRFDACVDAVSRLAPPGPVADIGCAQGNMALFLAEQGRPVVAIDLRPTFLGYMRKKWESGSILAVAADASHLPL